MIDENKQQKLHTLSDVNPRTWLKLVKLLDQSPDDEWEKIGQYFTTIFGPAELKMIRDNRLRKPPTEFVLNVLKQNLVPIDRIYKCFVDLQLIEACNTLEEAFPADVLYKKLPRSEIVNATTSQKNNETTSNKPEAASNNLGTTASLINEISNVLNLNGNAQNAMNAATRNEPITNGVAPFGGFNLIQIFSNLFYTSREANGQHDMASRKLVEIFESILPVMQEDTNNNDDRTLSNEFEVNLMLNGNFMHAEIVDRKLTFKKKEFKNVYDYLRELQAVKHLHSNLIVPVGILKSFDSRRLSLAYPAQRETQLLRDLAISNYENLQPEEYNVKQQLKIIKDVADGLNYLHSFSEFKIVQYVHGNLSTENILLDYHANGEFTAKIFDFTATVGSDETRPEEFSVLLKNEMYRFGLIVFNVISWQSMDQIECDNIHNAEYEDINIHKYQIYCQYKLDRQENDQVVGGLFRLFYRLTSPDYDASKGVNNKIIVLLDNMIAGNP